MPEGHTPHRPAAALGGRPVTATSAQDRFHLAGGRLTPAPRPGGVMQTFLPYPDFAATAEVLDPGRLGKQRVEVIQIVRALTVAAYAWKSHPAVLMWQG